MLITGTFLDEISYDIPHQNWGEKEWNRDFAAMKSAGIDTVILIRCGHKRFITFPSKYLVEKELCYNPPMDLVELFLTLADKYDMAFFFGLYDSGKYWYRAECEKELTISKFVAEEAWKNYGHHKSFKGWYLNYEISRNTIGMNALYRDLGNFVKDLSGNLPVMSSPFIAGIKVIGGTAVSTEEHEHDWDIILSEIQGAVDILAFQDGHCDYDELSVFLDLNRELAHRYGMQNWTNCETFDRDMPWRFPPIKWEKMLLKLEAARKAKLDKAITFEFSHFMSPNSMYPSAHCLFDRYMEYREKLLSVE